MSLWLIVILLAVMQGVTEFLPVSSSGHLAVLSNICKIDTETGLSLGIVLHAGSLLAIAAYYFRTLLGFFKKEQLHLLLMVIIGSVPAGIMGVLLKLSGLADNLFGDMLSLALGFLITASILRLTGKKKLLGNPATDLKDISVKQALTVGFAQMFAIVPGISRSGSTIAAGMLTGIKFESAAAFSFLLALPAIAGASLIEIVDLAKNNFQLDGFNALHLIVGFLFSALTSFAALTMLVKIIQKGKLSWFSWYLFVLGAGLMIWQIISMGGGK
jgi:undecaprenyl-diphosphatase